MLGFMRDKASSWIIKILLSFVAITFVSWGGLYYNDKKRGDIVASVDGEPITNKEYSMAYENLLRFYRDIYKGKIPPKQRESIKMNALDQLIQAKLVFREIEKAGISVSDDELIERIERDPSLNKDGRFDWNSYKRIPALRRAEYENGLKRELLFNKIGDIVRDGVKISDEEVKRMYERENAQVKVSYILMKPSIFEKEVNLEDEALASYFADNKDRYKTPEKVKIGYAFSSYSDFKNSLQIDEEGIKTYYKEHLDDFFLEKRVRASHILLKVKDRDKEGDVKKRAEKILSELREGADFSMLAKKYSEDSTASNGGDLGYFSKGRMVKEFEDAAFSLNKGDISEAVKTVFGFHIIKITDIQEKRTKSMEEVKEDIKKSLKKKEGAVLARRAIRRLLKALRSGEANDLEKAAERFKAHYKSTDLLDRKGVIPSVSDSGKLIEQAFILNKGDYSDMIKGKDGYYVISLIDKIEPAVPRLEDVRKEVKSDIIKRESRSLAEKRVVEMLEEFNKGTKLAEIAKRYGLAVKQTDFFKRSASLPDIGRDEEFIRLSFSLEKERAAKLVSGSRYYIIKKEDTKAVDEKDLDKELSAYRKRLLQKKRDKAYQNWILSLRQNSNVIINRQML